MTGNLRRYENELWWQNTHTHLPPRSQMTLKGERSKAVTTSLPQMFQMEFINCINFTISSSDLHTHTHRSESVVSLSGCSKTKVKTERTGCVFILTSLLTSDHPTVFQMTHWPPKVSPTHRCGRVRLHGMWKEEMTVRPDRQLPSFIWEHSARVRPGDDWAILKCCWRRFVWCLLSLHMTWTSLRCPLNTQTRLDSSASPRVSVESLSNGRCTPVSWAVMEGAITYVYHLHPGICCRILTHREEPKVNEFIRQDQMNGGMVEFWTLWELF